MEDWSDDELVQFLREAFHEAAMRVQGKPLGVPFIEKVYDSVCNEVLRRLKKDAGYSPPAPPSG
jgi:hypothetical protein